MAPNLKMNILIILTCDVKPSSSMKIGKIATQEVGTSGTAHQGPQPVNQAGGKDVGMDT